MDDVIGEVAKSMAPKAITDGINGAKQEICSLIDNEQSLDENYDRLDEEANQLYTRRDDVVTNIKKDNSKQASKACVAWLDKVQNTIEPAVLELKRKYDEMIDYNGVTGLSERSTFSEIIKKMCVKVHSHWEKGSIFLTEEALVDKPPEPVIKIKKAPNIENLPSLHGIIEKILEWLRDEKVKRIGVWGKVGVGKTAILQNINNNEQVANMFDLIIFATLPYEGDEEKSQCVDEKLERAKDNLQRQIAQRLKLNIEGNTDTKTIASRVSSALESKRYLLILDEVWSTFSLDAIGIQENEEDSKVLLASRYLEAFDAEMEVQEETEVEPLSDPDARKLFFEKLGRVSNQPNIDPIAELVIRECNNLPLVIDIVARTFKKIERKQQQQPQLRIDLWNSELVRLRCWPEVTFQGMDEFFKRLRYCYEALDDKDKKKCFLYGALYPNGYEVYTDHFLECWRADEFIGDAEKHSLHSNGLAVIRELTEVSFLESDEKMKHIRLSKVLRSLALKILSESTDQRYLVRAGENLLQPPSEEEWNGVKWISLMDNRLCSLPEKPDCKNLSTLLLQGNDKLKLPRDSFFQSMQSLRVLNLNGTGVTELPESISSLERLRVLYLNSCNQLNKLPPIIAELKQLEVLDIRGTRINCLPGEIKELHQLRCLRVSLSESDSEAKNVNIDVEVISKFYFLEELLIVVSPQNLRWNEVLICVSEKLATLEKSNGKPRHFQISIGEDKSVSVIDHYENKKVTRCLKYVNGEGTSSAISEVLADADEFELDGHKDSFNLSDFGDSKIKFCKIESCSEIETIIDATGVTKGVLECLETMYIGNLPKLGSMLKGGVPGGSLAQLTTVTFFKCSKLKRLFTKDLIQQLARLQDLKVQDCDEIEVIVMESDNSGPEPGELPRLGSLTLHNLPKLRCNWTANLRRNRPCELCMISGCPLQEELPSL